MDFEFAIERILDHEGGYVDPPKDADPGGETKWGISKRSYPDLDIKNLTRDQAKEIYRKDFWIPVQASKMPDAIAFQALDFAVNSSCKTAIQKLQRAAGVADDGYWGPVTQATVAAIRPFILGLNFLAERQEYMTSLKNWLPNSRGWARRIAKDMRYLARDCA